MTDDDERFDRLRELGITEYGARTYLALLRLGVSEARAASDVARVPQSKIYAVLDDLAGVGLVRVHPEHPKKYSAGDLAHFVDERRAELERKAEKLAKSRDEILDLFRSENFASAVLPGAAVQLRGRAQIARRVTELLRETNEDWTVMGVVTTPALYTAIRGDLEAAVGRGARARFLLPVSDRTVQDAKALTSIADVRARTRDSDLARRVTVLVSDHKIAMLIHWASIDGGETARDTALVTDDPAIASVIEHLVESLWERAEPFEKVATTGSGSALGASPSRSPKP